MTTPCSIRRRQRGFALIFVLAIGSLLFLQLGVSLQAHYALHRQNERALRQLQAKADALRLHVATAKPAAAP